MNYYVFYDSNNNVTIYKAESEPTLNGLTLLAEYAEASAPQNVLDAWQNASWYTIQNNQLVQSPNYAALQIQQAQQQQITLLRQGYTQTIASGFNVTIGTTQYTFGWSTDDKTNLLAVQEAITDEDLTFPVQYGDIHGNPVSIPDQTTLSSIKSTASKFFNNQHQQILTLIGKVNTLVNTQGTTVAQIQAVVWTPATY